ncbi:MAG: hypothetical protein AAFV53_19425 [Myxococcota bacterium]
MKAFCQPTGHPIAPFFDAMADVPILNRPLSDHQQQALSEAGFETVGVPPDDAPYLLYSDRTWFTAAALRRLREAGMGRMQADDPDWWTATGAVQQTPAPGLYELALLEPGAPPSFQVPPVTVDLGLRDADPPAVHATMAHALRPLRVGDAMVHQIDHWSHILRVNQLALAVRAEGARLRWENASWWQKGWFVLTLLWRARSIRKHDIFRALNETPRSADIHPSAVVELSVIGEGVEIGPNAVVRASILGDGVKVEDHASVNLSVLGEGARVGRYGMVNLCTLYRRAMVSSGGGFQASLFGEDSFLAWGATMLDLSFGRPVKVEVDGQRVDSGQHFLGGAIGHRARIGNGVRLNYGIAVPNDALIVAPSTGLVRSASDAEPDEPFVWEEGGGVRPARKR